MAVFRVQDASGRGPYRPGFSDCWVDDDGPDTPPWWIEIGQSMQEALLGMDDPQMHYGCGFSSVDQMNEWFTSKELRRLDRLGYKMVRFIPETIIAHTARQVVFGCRKPLSSIRPRISLVSKLARAA